MSIGKALAEGKPVVFTGSGVPEVVVPPGKEKQALELLEKKELIKVIRPVFESVTGK